jgi:hypothetical protein
MAELAQAGREIVLDVESPRPWVASTSGPIDVPDEAPELIDGLAAYGS